MLPSGIEIGSGNTNNTILYTNITLSDTPSSRSMRSHQWIVIWPWIDTLPEIEYFWNVFYQILKYKNQLPNIPLSQESSVENIKTAIFSNRETSPWKTCLRISHNVSIPWPWNDSIVTFGMQNVNIKKNTPLDLPLVTRWTEQFSWINESLLIRDTNIPASINNDFFLFSGTLENKILNTNSKKEFNVEYQECDIQDIKTITIPLNMKNNGLFDYQFYIHSNDFTWINISGVEKLIVASENEYIEKQKVHLNKLICFKNENECFIWINIKNDSERMLSIKFDIK